MAAEIDFLPGRARRGGTRFNEAAANGRGNPALPLRTASSAASLQ